MVFFKTRRILILDITLQTEAKTVVPYRNITKQLGGRRRGMA